MDVEELPSPPTYAEIDEALRMRREHGNQHTYAALLNYRTVDDDASGLW